jgi:hypothetical protein
MFGHGTITHDSLRFYPALLSVGCWASGDAIACACSAGVERRTCFAWADQPYVSSELGRRFEITADWMWSRQNRRSGSVAWS